MTQTILVIGATGAQGSSVAKHLAAAHFTVLAGTRDVNSEKAKALEKAGIKPVHVDLDDLASLEKAFKDVHTVFAVTNFWGLFQHPLGPGGAEISHAKNIIEACKKQHVKHLIFSTLETVVKDPKVNGKFEVPHFDAKGEIEELVKKSGLNYTLVRTSFYYQNFIYFVPPDPNGVINIPMKDKELIAFDVDDLGGVVASIVKSPEDFKSKIVDVAGDSLKVADVAKILTEATGKTFTYAPVTAEQFAAFGFPGADDLANMFKFYSDFGFTRDIAASKKLFPAIKSFKDWVAQNKAAFLK